MQQVSAWQKDNNDEPFWQEFADTDLAGLMQEAGFENADARYIKAKDGPINWYVVRGQKS